MTNNRHVFKKEQETETIVFIKALEAQGYFFNTPMFLDHERRWDDDDPQTPMQVEDSCPVCHRIWDRNYNSTNMLRVNGVKTYYDLEHCLNCEATWFTLTTVTYNPDPDPF